MGILGWVGFLVVIIATIYYVFFAAPQLITITPTAGLSAIAPIANVNLNPEDVINSKVFQGLHSPIPAPSPAGPAGVGRVNPFIAP